MKLNRACSLLMLGMVFCAGVVASPVAPAEALDVPDQSAAASITRAAERTGPAEGTGNSRAVDLLIELQNKTAGLDFNERARENSTAARPVPAVGTGAVPPVGGVGATQNAAGLFGSGAVPTPVARETTSRDSDWRSSTQNAPSGSNSQDHTRAEADGGGRLTLPRETIQWVRENRGMVVGGALVVLLVLWGTSIAVSQRRH